MSEWLPAWFVSTFRKRRVILGSYSAGLALKFGLRARTLVERYGSDFGVKLSKDKAAAGDWEIEDGGGMISAGVGGALTGHGADLLLIDDPVKNAEQAASKVYRDKAMDWFASTAYTRLEPGGAAILTQTRWHVDDMAGQLIKSGGSEPWTLVNFPAIVNGQALWPERYPVERLERIHDRIGEYYWSALFQQTPIVQTGGIFDVGKIQVIETAPAGFNRLVRFWDKAGSKQGDYTAGTLLGETGGYWFILDVVRFRDNAKERNARILQQARIDAARYGGRVQLWIEQEPGNGGKESAWLSSIELAEFGPRFDHPQGDKVLRARGIAAQVAAGNVKMVSAPWNKAFIEELEFFPNGANDDQVDSLSGAFNKAFLTAQVSIDKMPLPEAYVGSAGPVFSF